MGYADVVVNDYADVVMGDYARRGVAWPDRKWLSRERRGSEKLPRSAVPWRCLSCGKGISSPRISTPNSPISARREATDRLLALALAASAADRPGFEDRIVRLNMVIAGESPGATAAAASPPTTSTRSRYLGLVKAVQGFDPEQGHDFLSFAVPTIRGEIRRYFRDYGWAVRPPRSVQELQAGSPRRSRELFQALGRSPRPSEIAEHLGVDLDAGRGRAVRQRLLRPDLARRPGRRRATTALG